MDIIKYLEDEFHCKPGTQVVTHRDHVRDENKRYLVSTFQKIGIGWAEVECNADDLFRIKEEELNKAIGKNNE